MPQIRLHFTATRPGSQAVYGALEAEFEDDGFPLAISEIDEAAGLDEVSLYVDATEEGDARRRLDREAQHLGVEIRVEREDLDDVDWVAKSLEGLKPVRAGRFLVHGAHDRDKAGPQDIAIEIEAGLAFGTGHHGTTAGCLEMLARVVGEEQPRNALDLGTGSAVLAIALARLVRIPVLATDIDPVATEVAAGNVRLNEVEAWVETATAAGFDDPVFARRGPFDLIVANILAGPLIELAPQMMRHLAASGSLVLSGILDRQHDAVVAAYAAESFRHVRSTHLEGWTTIHLKS